MIVDVHAHYYPPAYLERIDRPGLLAPGSAPLSGQSVEERLELMDRVGIDVQILSVAQAQPYLPMAGDAADAATFGNDLYIELCRQHGGRFFTFAALPMPHVQETLDEIDRIWSDPHVVGVTMGCSIADKHVDDPMFEPIFVELNRRRARVFLHPRGECCVVDGEDYHLNWLVGAPFEDTIAALRLALSGVADRHADITFIVPHLGGPLPFLLGRIRGMTRGFGEDALRRMYFDTVSDSVDALRCACETLGSDRLLFGTDYPYGDEPRLEHRLSYLDEVGLDAAEVDRIRGSRASTLLDLTDS